MIKIKQARLLLNGRYRDGSKATFELGFKYTRYAIVLLAAISLPSFEFHTKKILGLQFERNRAARYAYNELIQRGQVKIIVENDKTFITFTEMGKKIVKKNLKSYNF